MAYERAKHKLQERRHAMGWSSARSSGATRKRDSGTDSADLREMFSRKRPCEHETSAPSNRSNDHAKALPVAASADATDEEDSTREKLTAAGFPPELARRAASAYPCNVERAADWIMSSNDW